MFDGHGHLIGVWDVDSPLLNRFDEDDRRGMEALVEAWIEHNDPTRFEAAA
jgi:GAF domain-containing protein